MKERLTLEMIRHDIAAALEEEPERIQEGENLLDLGLDSVRIMLLVHRWTEVSGVAMDFGSLAEEPELGAWWRYFEERMG